jgi:hypothetical protein
MSADRAPMFVDDRDCGPNADAWHDPHDIIPDAFHERFADCASARAALQQAEQAPTDSDTDALPRCPADGCGSIKIQHKPGMVRQSNQRDGDFTCNECGSHFDTPRESVNEAVGEQATLGEVRDS